MYNNQTKYDKTKWGEDITHLPLAYLTNFQKGVYDAVVIGIKAKDVNWQKGPPQGYSHGFAFGLGLCEEIDNLQKED